MASLILGTGVHMGNVESKVEASISHSCDVADLVNLTRYPVADLASQSAKSVIADGRAQLAHNGLCLLPDFLTPQALAAIADEARLLRPGAYYEERGIIDDGSGRLK